MAGKKYLEAAAKIENKAYSIEDAIKLAKETSYVNFDATVEVAYNLNLDVKQADQQLRGALVLPNGTGKTQRVLVIAEGDHATQAKEAGADFVGSDDLLTKIKTENWFEFDVMIATPPMMAKLGMLGKILGPKGLMPNPKTGTVTMNVAQAVKDAKGGKINYRTDKEGNVHVIIGKVSFDDAKLVENFKAIDAKLRSLRPAVVKGNYVKNTTITTTMGPSVRVQLD